MTTRPDPDRHPLSEADAAELARMQRRPVIAAALAVLQEWAETGALPLDRALSWLDRRIMTNPCANINGVYPLEPDQFAALRRVIATHVRAVGGRAVVSVQVRPYRYQNLVITSADGASFRITF